jgi:hypothetical protein
MQQRTFEPWTTSHLSKCIKRLGYVRVIAHKRSREASPAAQYAYKLLIQGYGIEQEHMVFADEVSTVSCMFLHLVHQLVPHLPFICPLTKHHLQDSRCGNRSRAWVKKGDISKLGATFVRGRRYCCLVLISLCPFLPSTHPTQNLTSTHSTWSLTSPHPAQFLHSASLPHSHAGTAPSLLCPLTA